METPAYFGTPIYPTTKSCTDFQQTLPLAVSYFSIQTVESRLLRHIAR
jgi:hypothetical protein